MRETPTVAKARAHWRRVIAEHERSGLPVRRFCRQQGVGEHSFYVWRKRLRESEGVRFALVEAGGVEETRGSEPLELVLATGELLRIGAGVDAGTLRTVLQALRP